MNCPRPFSLLCLSAAIAAGAAWPAGAQDSVVFSKPPSDPAAKASSLIDQQSHQTASMKMPAPLFNESQASPDFDATAVMPRPQPLTPQQIQELQRQRNEQRNWGLMTPEEIFGVPTVAKIFGLPAPEEEKNLTPEERFLHRQQQEHSGSATNSLRAVGGVWDNNNNPFQKTGDRDKRRQGETGDPARRNSLFQSPFNNPSTPEQTEADQQKNSLWQSAFSTPRAQTKEDPEQVAQMERFRSLLESQPALETPQATPGAGSFQSPAAPKAVPEYQAPTAYIPAANFEAQRQQEIGKPIGITPLPPISAQPKKKDDSKPLVKPPPWLSDKPQPNTPPRWNF